MDDSRSILLILGNLIPILAYAWVVFLCISMTLPKFAFLKFVYYYCSIMKKLLIPLLFLSSCDGDFFKSNDTEKTFTVNYKEYTIYKGSDSCEYYAIPMASTYSKDKQYFHYPQCSFCKKHK